MSDKCRFSSKTTELAEQLFSFLDLRTGQPKCTQVELLHDDKKGDVIRATWYDPPPTARSHSGFYPTRYQWIIGGITGKEVKILSIEKCGSAERDFHKQKCDNPPRETGSVSLTRFQRAVQFLKEKSKK